MENCWRLVLLSEVAQNLGISKCIGWSKWLILVMIGAAPSVRPSYFRAFSLQPHKFRNAYLSQNVLMLFNHISFISYCRFINLFRVKTSRTTILLRHWLLRNLPITSSTTFGMWRPPKSREIFLSLPSYKKWTFCCKCYWSYTGAEEI